MDLKYLRSDYKNVRGIEKDVDVVAFNIAANGSLAKFDLVDQAIDAFEDTTGVNSGASTNDGQDTTGKYMVGKVAATVGFTSTGATTWTCPAPVTSAEILVVAGGGGGCGGYGGGGGAGGVVHHATYPVVATTVYDLTVGAGAPGRPVNTGVNGDNSSFNNNNEGSQSKMTAIGGGGSTYYYGPGGQDPGNDGGSGGGGAYQGRPGGNATQGNSGGGTGYGYDGGDGTNTPTDEGGSGGGGAGGVGQSCGSDDLGGPGGPGREFSNFGAYGTDSSNTGSATPGSGSGKGYFAGGGGGSAVKGSGAAGGVGGGAKGMQTMSGTSPHGFPNTGGGGGGARAEGGSATGGNGGSGIVLIKYEASGLDMTLVGNTITAQSQPERGDLLIAYTNGAGTASLNTDVKGFVSRDATNFTEGVLVSQGTTAGQLLASFSNLNISGQPAGTSMRYKITTHNQSGSKETRVHGAALGWS